MVEHVADADRAHEPVRALDLGEQLEQRDAAQPDDLTDEQKLAIAFRWLAREGFAENLAGHITWQRPGTDTMLVNPWGLWWREIAASDVCEIDEDGQVILSSSPSLRGMSLGESPPRPSAPAPRPAR